MFKSIQPLCHRYLLLLLSVSLCVFITTACDDEDCDDEDNDICIHNPIPAFGTPSDESPTSSVNNPPNETTLPNPPNETTLPNPPPEEEVNLVCGQIVRELDHPGAYNEPVTFSNTAVATLTLFNISTLDLVAITTQSGPFQLPLDYCITGPASLLDTDDIYVVFGLVNQENDDSFNIGDLFTSQSAREEDPFNAAFTLPQYDAVTPLAGLEDCTADNSQFDCVIACSHPDIALYGFCADQCANNPSLSNCPVFVGI